MFFMRDAMNPVLFSSKNEVWATPQDFFDKLNEEFRFTLDPCALPDNAKCKRFYTPEQDGLAQSWGGGECVLQPAIRQEYLFVGIKVLLRSGQT